MVNTNYKLRLCKSCNRYMPRFKKSSDSEFRKYHKICWDKLGKNKPLALPDTNDGWFFSRNVEKNISSYKNATQNEKRKRLWRKCRSKKSE